MMVGRRGDLHREKHPVREVFGGRWVSYKFMGSLRGTEHARDRGMPGKTTEGTPAHAKLPCSGDPATVRIFGTIASCGPYS